MTNEPYKYALRYKPNLEHRDEGYTKDDAGQDGLTDCLLGISILLPPDGSYSQAIVINEHGKEKRALTPKEIFKAWSMLGMSLHQEGMLKGWQSEIVKIHSKMMRDVLRDGK